MSKFIAQLTVVGFISYFLYPFLLQRLDFDPIIILSITFLIAHITAREITGYRD